MRLNSPQSRTKNFTHEGAVAKHINPEQALRRSVMSCFLWEREFYEDGVAIADRITELADAASKEFVAALAIEARTDFHLRHVPLLLLLSLIKKGGEGVADTIAQVIQRPDEMAELLAMYWRDGRRPLAKQLQKGLAAAFGNFNEYSLAKYNRDGPVKLRDVLFLSHAKPADTDREVLYRSIANQELKSPDTWEVALSSGESKKDTFTRLITEGNLGYMALLRNLRNMAESGVDTDLVRDALIARMGAHRVLPFRYVAAARACPQYEPFIDQALCESIMQAPKLSGKTLVLVDVSGSMATPLSARSDLTRMDAAAALASVINADLRMFSFSMGNYSWNGHGSGDVSVEVPPRRGLAGIDAIVKSQSHGGTLLGRAVNEMNAIPHDRLIVVTDEQSHDRVPDPVAKYAYMINVASNKNGIGYGRWTHIDGFSEAVINFIHEVERDG